MADLKPSSFCKYEMTDIEAIQAAILNSAQKQHIQNLLADVAETKLALVFDPEHTLRHVQTEAELQGQLGTLKYLLALSDEAEERMKNINTETR